MRLADDTVEPTWTRRDVAIDLPTGLTYDQAALIVRTILHELGAPQPTTPARATCFCGDVIRIPGLMLRHTGRAPAQRASVLEATRGT